LLEDAGALIGLVFALTGVGLAAVTGNEIWDAVGTLCIGGLLIVIAGFLTVEMKSLLIGEAATEIHVDAIRKAVEECPEVVRVIDLRTQHIGPEELLVAGKLEFSPSLSTSGLAAAIDMAETAIRQTVPLAARIYLEPDVWREDHIPTPDGPVAGAEH
jgi:divalent metal cation (Fe/Co/Zn/Cd) transporter